MIISRKIKIATLWCLLLCCLSCDNGELTILDLGIFKHTPAWDLAKAVENENISKINKIALKDPSLVNYQEPIYGITLLMRAIGSEKYKSAKALLNNNANPNIISSFGSTALFMAISYSWYDTNANTDPKFVKLLLNYGADPNITYCSPERPGETDPTECGTSPLMHAVRRGISKLKLLVEFGADINYKTKTGKTAAIVALLTEDVDAAHFLIVEKKAKITEPFYFYSITNPTIIEKDKPHYPVDLLLDWIYEIGSVEYLKKMEIVKEFRNQGIDYSQRKENVNNLPLDSLKILYPDNWEEFLKKY